MATILTPAEIKQKIEDWITWLGGHEITGAHLNAILSAIMDYVGVGFAFKDSAPAVAPSSDVPVVYIAGPGTYTGYEDDAVEVPQGSMCIFKYDGSDWSKSVLKIHDPVGVSQNTSTDGENIKVGDGELYGLQDSKNFVNSFIRKVKGGNVYFTPTVFYGGDTDFSVEFKFRMPTDITTLGFLFAWMTDDQFTGCYINQGKIFTYYKGVEKTYRDISALAGKVCKITMNFSASNENGTYWNLNDDIGILPFFKIPAADNRIDSAVYFGSYADGAATSNCLADLYYFTIKTADSYEVFNAATIQHNDSNIYIDNSLLINNSKQLEDYFTSNSGELHGNILISGGVTVPSNTHLKGNGCTISFVDYNSEIILGEDCAIENVKFNCGASQTRINKYEADPTINPLYRYVLVPIVSTNDADNYASKFGSRAFVKLAGRNASIINCTFYNNYNWTPAVKTIAEQDVAPYESEHYVSIVNCFFNDCMCGVANFAEFTRIVGCEFKNCPIGLYALAGNLNISACHFVRNDLGVVFANGGNSGHSQYSGIEAAHCGIAGIYGSMLLNRDGVVITGSQFADAPIIGKLGGMGLVGCRIDSWFNFYSPSVGEKTGIANYIHSCEFDLQCVARDYGDPESSDPATALGLAYYFQMGEETAVDLKQNISLNPQYLPSNIINN